MGGNALAPPQESLTWEGQLAAARALVPGLLDLRGAGYQVVVTHGNGPQVGAILQQQERAADRVAPSPLDVCVAESQAYVGYALQVALQEGLDARGEGADALALVTLVRVDPDDPVFREPSKPIGPLVSREQARELEQAGGTVRKDPRGGFRRVVPSPEPQEILGVGALRGALAAGNPVLIVAGGGGIPVVRAGTALRGVEAVVDKDRTSALLATALGAELLVLVTDVPCVYQGFGTEDPRPLSALDADEARALLKAGEFPPGSMGPKVEGALRFLEGGGRRAVITDRENLAAALEGRAGTTLTP